MTVKITLMISPRSRAFCSTIPRSNSRVAARIKAGSSAATVVAPLTAMTRAFGHGGEGLIDRETAVGIAAISSVASRADPRRPHRRSGRHRKVTSVGANLFTPPSSERRPARRKGDAHVDHDALEHRRKEEEVGELRVELRPPPLGDRPRRQLWTLAVR